ncbi:hypothetical protein OHA40_21420 [Nocardia sp. NBC_00508]|uniref:DUF6879 family protein n=1 Tax=Nocardia sp. NBC_00508 TaxID=2975992 RepID=UPI002E803506|nr:DUF6879 family protein [Nocardia sp. NBC_00508]WUD64260.1 hypothetical protein OHA40_21420 [Nocardia sp. NBC_00508]
MQLVTTDPFPPLFTRAKRRAFHCETRDSYLVDDEVESLRRFLAGEPPLPPPDTWHAWRALMTETTGRGVAVQRVRVVTVPHSDYVRWLLSTTANGDLGLHEDIRWLPRHLAESLPVPLDDWWLFDDELLAYNVNDADGAAAGIAVTEDPLVTSVYGPVRDQLWDRAIPHEDYIRSEHTQV